MNRVSIDDDEFTFKCIMQLCVRTRVDMQIFFQESTSTANVTHGSALVTIIQRTVGWLISASAAKLVTDTLTHSHTFG